MALPPIVIAVALLFASPQSMLSRLQGHHAYVVGEGIVIEDVAGEGKPLVGIVERRGKALWLVGWNVEVELRGPLARPRIAGPGYRVWVTGRRDGDVVVARRIGILETPADVASAGPARD